MGGRKAGGMEDQRREDLLSTRIEDSSGSGLPDKKNGNVTILQGNRRFVESHYRLEEDFEELIRSQSKVLFGKDTIFIYTKCKLDGVVLGATIPDGCLFVRSGRRGGYWRGIFKAQNRQARRNCRPGKSRQD
jgi:hypothetical protein